MLVCCKCCKWFHSDCVPSLKAKGRQALAWGEYSLWRFICKRCPGGEERLTIRDLRVLLPRALGRVALLNALMYTCNGALQDVALLTVPVADLTRLLPDSSGGLPLGIESCQWKELGKAIVLDYACIHIHLSLDPTRLGFVRPEHAFPELFAACYNRRPSGRAPANPIPIWLPSTPQPKSQSSVAYTLTPVDGPFTMLRATRARQVRITQNHQFALASLMRGDGVTVYPGCLLRIQVQLETGGLKQTTMMACRVIDLLYDHYNEGERFAYVQWLWGPAHIAQLLQAQGGFDNSNMCDGIRAKIDWLNSQESYGAALSDAAFPDYPGKRDSQAAMAEWVRRCTALVDQRMHRRELFLTLDTDYVNMQRVSWEPITAHFLPPEPHDGCHVCSVALEKGLPPNSRWLHPVSILVDLSRDPALLAMIASAIATVGVVLRNHLTPPKGPAQYPPPPGLVLRPRRPNYTFSYGFNPKRGFFVLPRAVVLTLELVGEKEKDTEASAELMTWLAEVRQPPEKAKRSVMDADVEIIRQEGPDVAVRVLDTDKRRERFFQDALGVQDLDSERLSFEMAERLDASTTVDAIPYDPRWRRDDSVLTSVCNDTDTVDTGFTARQARPRHRTSRVPSAEETKAAYSTVLHTLREEGIVDKRTRCHLVTTRSAPTHVLPEEVRMEDGPEEGEEDLGEALLSA